MNNINIITKDLNLLVIFDSVYRNSNLSRAAEELAVSQSAVSHALSRLRDLFEDPLFTRLPRGMVPTPKALALAPKVTEAIEKIRGIFETESFSLKSTKGKISIASSEYLEQTLMIDVFFEIKKEAPNLVFLFRNASGKLPRLAMERGEIDIAIAGYFGQLPAGFYQQKLFDFDFVCVAKKNHSRIKTKLNLDLYTELEHLLISPQGDLWGVLDEKLKELSQKRKVIAGFENYMTPGWIVAQSDSILTVPRPLAEFYKNNLEVNLYELPISSPVVTIVQAWHERTHSNPLHKYLRSKIQTFSVKKSY